jgi:hypothetical protein
VAIEDLSQHVLAYSNLEDQRIDPLRRRGILDRRVPVGPRDAELYRRVLATDGVVRFAQHGEELPRAAIAIRAGTLPLGTVWAIEGERGLSRQAEQAILDGAQLAALHMLRARSAFDIDRFRRGELLRALLEASRPPEDSWSRLGLTPEQAVCLVGLAPAWSPGADGGPLLTHVAREVGRLAGALRPDAAVTTAARAVYVLVSGRDARPAARRLAERLVQDVTRALEGSVHAGVSSERRGAHAITSLRHEVDQVLRVSAGGMRPAPVAAFEDVRSQVLLIGIADELDRRPELRQPALAGLPGGPRGELAGSVLAWLESGQSVAEAAARLHVHPNTLRYRLRRFSELAGLDLDDPDERLAVWLELRLTARDPQRPRDRHRPR